MWSTGGALRPSATPSRSSPGRPGTVALRPEIDPAVVDHALAEIPQGQASRSRGGHVITQQVDVGLDRDRPARATISATAAPGCASARPPPPASPGELEHGQATRVADDIPPAAGPEPGRLQYMPAPRDIAGALSLSLGSRRFHKNSGPGPGPRRGGRGGEAIAYWGARTAGRGDNIAECRSTPGTGNCRSREAQSCSPTRAAAAVSCPPQSRRAARAGGASARIRCRPSHWAGPARP
jgi:hypothetical protein